MAISQETWAIVAATGLGPVLAVAVSLFREAIATKYNRRLYVFRTLMATRKIGISAAHVNALNLVELEFYKCPKVEAAWNSYKNHLNDSSKPEDEAWHETKERLLAKLLSEIGTVLRFKIPAMDIFKGGYAPKSWAYREMRYTGALEYGYELSQGKKPLPIWVCGVAAPKQPPVMTAPDEGGSQLARRDGA